MGRKRWSPPTIPARLPGWERAYVATLEAQLKTPFGWSAETHCLGMPAALCLAMTGVDPMDGLSHEPSEAGALRLLVGLGFKDVETALQAVFPEIPLLQARRGDCGVLEQQVEGRPWLSTLVVMGDKAVGKGPRGPVFAPVSSLRRTFAIGAF